MEYVTKENFNEKIHDGTVLIDFFANWCGPCRMLSPFLEEMAEKYAGKLHIYKVNVDDDPELAMNYNVASIPNLILFKNGQPVDQMVGFLGDEALENFISKAL